MFQTHRLVYHSTLGSRVMKKKKNITLPKPAAGELSPPKLHTFASGPMFQVAGIFKLTNTETFTARFVLTGDATPDRTGYASCGRFLEPLAPFLSWLFEKTVLRGFSGRAASAEVLYLREEGFSLQGYLAHNKHLL